MCSRASPKPIVACVINKAQQEEKKANVNTSLTVIRTLSAFWGDESKHKKRLFSFYKAVSNDGAFLSFSCPAYALGSFCVHLWMGWLLWTRARVFEVLVMAQPPNFRRYPFAKGIGEEWNERIRSSPHSNRDSPVKNTILLTLSVNIFGGSFPFANFKLSLHSRHFTLWLRLAKCQQSWLHKKRDHINSASRRSESLTFTSLVFIASPVIGLKFKKLEAPGHCDAATFDYNTKWNGHRLQIFAEFLQRLFFSPFLPQLLSQ